MYSPIQPFNLVLRIAAKMLIPLILMFALYVQFHGESGPGGGFQAGVIFAAAFILYALVFGMGAARAVAPGPVLRVLAALGVLLYCGVGMAAIFAGGNFLDYDVLATDTVAGQHLGIFLVELGIGITVASVMISIFYAFAERGVTR
jgi:multicomponent Na+:H+ antiporter subunit B